jgi:uncharacterized protein (TIGR00251 family)
MRKRSDDIEVAVLAVRVIPRARKDEIVEILDDGTVKIRLTAPPVEGKANKALVSFLSRVIMVPRSQIEILRGEKSRNKLISIHDINNETVRARIKIRISME